MAVLEFRTKPWKHQTQALKYLMGRSFGALFLDMGAGKTKIMIDLVVNKGFKRTLIIAPKRVCRVWPPEFNKHAPRGRAVVLDVSKLAPGKRIHAINSMSTDCEIAQEVIICNYESVWREPLRSYLLKNPPEAVICDESHRIKTPGSKVSRFLQLIGRRVDNRYIMTGTFLAQSPLDCYAQYRFVDPRIFGTNHTVFKEEYGNWIKAPGGFAFLNKKNPYKNLDKLQEKIFSCAFTVEVDLNLPPTQDILVEFDMSSRAQRYYKELVKEGCLELAQGTVEAGNVLTVITRLQQLTSGYLPMEDESGIKTVERVDDSRQETLKELLEDIPEDEPIVVFAKYRKDINNIRNTVRDIGRKSSELSGRRDTLDRWQDGKTQVLVVQIASGAEGNDFTRAKYCIYYTITTSLSKYKQSRKRVHRPGQTRPVVYYTIVAKMKKGKTIDEQIIESLAKNESIIDKIMSSREV